MYHKRIMISSKQKKNELEEELEASRQQLETLKQDYEKTKKELLDEKTQKLDEDRKHSFARAWAATYFGEDCLVLIDGEKYLQLVSQEPYSATSEGVQAVYKQCLNSMSGLGVYVDQVNTHTTKVACFQSFRDQNTYLQYRSQLRYYTVFLHKSALSLINVDKVRVVPVP